MSTWNLESKVALITGGATGLGRATGLALARLGCSVAVNHLRSMKVKADETAAELAALSVRALAVEADVTDGDACRTMVAAVVREFGRLDILVNSPASRGSFRMRRWMTCGTKIGISFSASM